MGEESSSIDKVLSGEIKSKSKARIIWDGVVVYTGEILSIFSIVFFLH